MHSTNHQTGKQKDCSGEKDIPAFLQTRLFGAGLALLSLLGLLIYVFFVADYQAYLFSDMEGFWTRALQRLDGNPFDIEQYWMWPPGYHIILAEIFRFLRGVGLGSLIRLETALTLNIVLYAFSVYALQRMAMRWFAKPSWMLVTLLLYGFGFPAWYFNAFLLSDNFSRPLLVMAVALLYCREEWKTLISAAVLFSIATIARPSIGPYGLVFVIFLWIRWRFSRPFLARAAVFSVLFFALIFGAGTENYRISQGKVSGLFPGGGLQFFIANSRYFRIDIEYAGTGAFLVSPAVSDRPENGYFKTNVPFYEQDYYYRLGWDFIRHDPLRVIKNVEHIRDLFWAVMLPNQETPGYDFFRPVWDIFKIVMFFALGLYLWMGRGLLPGERPLFGLMISLIAITVLVSYVFTGEPRYTYAIIFAFYLLFFKLIELFCSDWRRWKKVLPPFAVLCACGIGITMATVYILKPHYPPNVKLNIRPLENPEVGIMQTADVGRVYFPYRGVNQIRHADTGLKLTAPGRISARTSLEVTGPDPLPLRFDFFSAWPFEVFLDGRRILMEDDPFYPVEQSAEALLNPGRHTVEIGIDCKAQDGGFAASYSYRDATNWRHRNMIGVNDGRVQFHLPAESTGRH